MNLGLRDKRALITGGSRGIGRAIALALADEGCNIAICARQHRQLQSTYLELKSKGIEVKAICCDVLKLEDINKVFKAIKPIDILVNNVGGGGRWGNDYLENTDEQIWLDVYTKNALAAMRFSKLVLPYMVKQGWGRVITIAARMGREGGGRPWFNMAKAAEISLMKTLAMNPLYAQMNITFNSVAPGAVMIPDTGWTKTKEENPEEFREFAESLPLGRLGTPEEVANLVVFLCSDKASLISGACIAIDGGESRSF